MSSSSSRPKVNLRSTAVKRIMQEASELADPQHDDFVAAPLESDIFEWHCTMRGVPGTEFAGGLYHLRILLPPTYPMSAPDIMLLTPNGRFELGKKICIDGLTSFHAGSWQPAWGVRTAITGLRSFWMQGGEALSAIGALDYPKEERRRLAKLSKDWVCPTCGVKNSELLSDSPASVEPLAVPSEAADVPLPLAIPAEETAEDSPGPEREGNTDKEISPGAVEGSAVAARTEGSLPPSTGPTSAMTDPLPMPFTTPVATPTAPTTISQSSIATALSAAPAQTLTQRFIPATARPAHPARSAPAHDILPTPTRTTRPTPTPTTTTTTTPTPNLPSWMPSFQSMRQLIDLSILFLVFVLFGMLFRRIA